MGMVKMTKIRAFISGLIAVVLALVLFGVIAALNGVNVPVISNFVGGQQ